MNSPLLFWNRKLFLVIDSFGTKNSAMNIPICNSVTKYSTLVETLHSTPSALLVMYTVRVMRVYGNMTCYDVNS